MFKEEMKNNYFDDVVNWVYFEFSAVESMEKFIHYVFGVEQAQK